MPGTAAAPRLAPAGPADADALARLVAAHLEAGLPRRVWTPARLRVYLRDPAVVARRAFDGDRFAGYATLRCEDARASIDLLVVEPDLRRHGVGRALVGALAGHAASLGAVAIDLDVRASNAAALRFYAALGFRERGRRPAHYCGIEDAVCLRLPLPAVPGTAG